MKNEGTAVISCPDIVLRPFTADDAPAVFHGWTGSRDASCYIMEKPHAGLAETETMLNKYAAAYADPAFYMWAIGYEGRAVGYICGNTIDEAEKSLHIGYCIAPDFRRMGLASEAVCAVVKYFFSLGYETVYAEHHPDNIASAGVLQNTGFTIERLIPGGGWLGGKKCDCIRWSIRRNAAMPDIETKRLILTMGRREHAESVLAIMNTPFVRRFNAYPERSIEDVNAMLDEQCNFVLIEKQSGKVIGTLGIEDDPLRHNEYAVMIDYMLDKAYTKKGYMTEAVKAAVRFLFEQGGKDIVTARVYAGNADSMKLLERVGFRHEGTLHLASRRYDGKVFDDELYCLVKPSEPS